MTGIGLVIIGHTGDRWVVSQCDGVQGRISLAQSFGDRNPTNPTNLKRIGKSRIRLIQIPDTVI